MITVIDYGMGNLRSVEKAFRRLGAEVIITGDRNAIAGATKLVLPGVGHFKSGMDHLKSLGLIDILNKKVLEENVPILGICLGMQLFTKVSEEGNVDGLGWIDAETTRFNLGKSNYYKVPHIGWNTVELNADLPLFRNADPAASYYFVHSYKVDVANNENRGGKTDYKITFDSCIYKDNIIGVQFHPEKSLDAGMLLLKNFIEQY